MTYDELNQYDNPRIKMEKDYIMCYDKLPANGMDGLLRNCYLIYDNINHSYYVVADYDENDIKITLNWKVVELKEHSFYARIADKEINYKLNELTKEKLTDLLNSSIDSFELCAKEVRIKEMKQKIYNEFGDINTK